MGRGGWISLETQKCQNVPPTLQEGEPIPHICHFFYTGKIFGEENLHRNLHSKLPIFRAKSVKIYTGQKKLHGRRPWRSWQIWGMIIIHHFPWKKLPALLYILHLTGRPACQLSLQLDSSSFLRAFVASTDGLLGLKTCKSNPVILARLCKSKS